MSTAMVLSQKYDARSSELFRGETENKYKANIKRIDSEIEMLREELAEKEAKKPLIEIEPVFGLCQENINGSFPEPPDINKERNFCQYQKADAFLTGQVKEFHGRFILRVQLYILYTNSYVYEDDIIFSLEDTEEAVDDISSKLIIALSGNNPAAISVNAVPPESQILLNSYFAGRGNAALREYPPGKIEIAVAAEGYTPQLIETDLAAGELTQVDVTLSPLQFSDVTITTPDFSSVYIYDGSLFAGETPLTLKLPMDNLQYIYAVAKSGEELKAVFTTPDLPGETITFKLDLKTPYPQGQQRVDKARKRHYWTWGSTWITGILAWVMNGISKNYYNDMANNSGKYSNEFYSRGTALNIVSISTLAVFGGVAVFDASQMIRYIYTSNQSATPILKDERKEKAK